MGCLIAVNGACGRMISMGVVLKPVTGSVQQKDEFPPEADSGYGEMVLPW